MDVELQSFGACIAEAHAASRPLRLRGAGTKDFYGEHCEGDILDLSHYQGIVDYDPSELVLTARCGTRLSVIESLLSQQRQCLAFEPPAFAGDPTLGGIVAAGLSGPQRVRAGAARDFVLGAVLMAIDGELLHFGGRVMKNVAGFDVSRLLCGSLGILGPIVEVSLKVLPRPRAQQTLCFDMSATQALQAFGTWAGKPLPICASAWVDNRAWIRLAGAPAALDAACKQLGGEPIDAASAHGWWQSVRDQTHDFFRGAGTLWRLSLPATAPLHLPASNAPGAFDLPFIEWGGALRWYSQELTEDRTQDGAQPLPAVALRAEATALGGTASLWRGGAPGQRLHPLHPAVLKIHQQLKMQFDPHRIFNRGRLVAGL